MIDIHWVRARVPMTISWRWKPPGQGPYTRRLKRRARPEHYRSWSTWKERDD